MEKGIEFIYFDVGGVAILDFSKTNKWNEMINDLGCTGNQKKSLTDFFIKTEAELCIGKKSIDEFTIEVSKRFGIKFPEDYSMLKDFVNRFEKNITISPVLEELNGKYGLGLLTNMYIDMFELIEERGILPDGKWNTIIDSSKVGKKKPEADIYIHAEILAGTKPENIAFIDNTPENLLIPKSRGWKTFLYDPSDTQKSNQELAHFLGQNK